jgi:threonine dehydrogenase-like Zn-dependent dehydrogenase
MKAAQAVARGRFEIVDAPVPAPAPGKVLVRLQRIGLCGSDFELITRSRAAAEYPLLLGFSGHECVGVVEAVEPGLGFAVGDRVLIVPPEANGFVEWFLAEPSWLVKQPQHVHPELLVCGQVLGTAVHCLRKLPQLVDLDVVILGQAGAGLLLAAMISRAGARRVIGVDIAPHLLEVSKRMGATHIVRADRDDVVGAVSEITNGQLADIVIEAVGIERTIRQCPFLVKKFGLVVSFGVPKEDVVPFEYERFLRKQLRAVASDRTGDEPGHISFRLAAELLAQGRIDVSPLITHRMPFERLQTAFDMQMNKQDNAVKVILEVSGD